MKKIIHIPISTRTSSAERFVLFFTMALFYLFVFQPIDTANASLTDWKAGRIIDDGVFTKYNTMSASAIQSFLNEKVPLCDTNGQQLSEYGGPDLNGDGKVQRWEWGKHNYNQTTFICLKDYTENGKSASQIIHDASLNYRINPQVLIVLLQKEQGLINDTWPLNTQYRSATGYGCPDTAACDSQYYGLTNQVKWAAIMFRAILDDSPTWYTPYILGKNYIQYNPSVSCGGSTVSIQNRATQALYNYTPYQPNQATLDAEWGSAPCGAYGNRNFYLYFTSWFGSTSDFQPLLTPRHMILKTATQKTNLVSLEKNGDLGTDGQLVYFTSKATIDGVTYVRSEYDTIRGNNFGFAMSELREMPSFQPLLTPRHMILKTATQKTNLVSLEKNGDLGTDGQLVYFTSKATIDGVTYVRSEYDTLRDNIFGFAVNELSETSS